MKRTLQDSLEINYLFDIYGKLLTEHQQEIFTSYFEYNLSLAEIAQQNNISRNAISDCLNKSVNKLYEYEEKLNFCAVFKKMSENNKVELDIFNKTLEDIKNGI